MNVTETKKLTNKLLEEYAFLGNLSSRSMFGGFGLLLDGVMFAWVFDNKLYLRANQSNESAFTNLAMPPLSLSAGVISKLLHYYCVTDTLKANEEQLNELLELSIAGAVHDRLSKLKRKENRLKDLPNMTLSLERLLMQIGITRFDQLKEMGAAMTFHQLKCINRHLSINILFILASAIKGHHVAILSDEEKHLLLRQIEILNTKRNPL